MRLGEGDQRVAQCNELRKRSVDGAAHPQSQVGGDLIVARSSGVQPLSRVTDERGQPSLDIEVNVLEIARKLKLAAFDFGANLREAGFDRAQVVGRNDVRVRQHSRMREW